MSINERLKQFLEERGIKQSYLVKKTNMTADAISRILAGKRKITAEELLLICEALHVDPRIFAPLKKAS